MAVISKTQFLALFERLFPRAFWEPRKLSGNGYEILRAYAKVGERVSQAIQNHKDGAFILDATGPSFSTCTVEFYRPDPDPAAPALIMRAGTIVRTSQTGRNYVTTEDAEFGVGDEVATPQVGAKALVASAEYNVQGPFTTAGGEELPGEIDTIQKPFQTLPTDNLITFLDDSVLVRQINDATGGMGAGLDQLGLDLGLARHQGEADDAYQERLRTLADTISPDAMIRAMTKLLAPLGASAEFIEIFEPRMSVFASGPNTTFTTPFGPYQPTNNFCNRTTTDTLEARVMSQAIYRGFFLFLLPNLASIRNRAIYCSSSASSPASPTDYVTPLGRRAWNFVSMAGRADTATILYGFLNAKDYARNALLIGAFDLIAAIKPAGVGFVVLVRNTTPS